MSDDTSSPEETPRKKRGPAPPPKDPVLVTGATSGIGHALVRRLAARKVPLIIHARDRARGEAVLEELKPLSDGAMLELVVGDLGSQADVRAIADAVAKNHPSLHAIVNNAGVLAKERMTTTDGIETMLAVNHVAPFMFTRLLQPVLEAGDGGRVVNINSFMHKYGRVNLDDLNAEKAFASRDIYSTSKLLSLLTTYAWARKLDGNNVTVNAYNPGLVRTKMLGSGAIRALSILVAKSPSTAASTAGFLATSDKVAGSTGGYYAATGVGKDSSPVSRDEDLQEAAFAATEGLIKN